MTISVNSNPFQDYFRELPEELMRQIFRGLPFKVLKKTSCICRAFYELSNIARVEKIHLGCAPISALGLSKEQSQHFLKNNTHNLTYLKILNPNQVLYDPSDQFPNLRIGTFKNVSIPSIAKSKHLTHLVLKSCNLLNPSFDPTIFKNFPSLKVLHLDNNKLTDQQLKPIWDSIHSEKFTQFNAHNNRIGEEGAAYIANSSKAPRLKSLGLQRNQIKNGLLPLLEKCTNLTELDVASNKILKLPEWSKETYEHLSNLRKLTISCNPIGDLGIEFLTSAMPNLIQLEIAKTNMTNKSAKRIASTDWTSLQSLDYSENKCPTALSIFGTSSKLTNLEELHLWKCQLSKESVIKFFSLGKLPFLTSLDLDENSIDNPLLMEIQKSTLTPQLKYLSLSFNRFSFMQGFESTSFSNITELSINNVAFGDKEFYFIANADSLKNLVELNVNNCELTALAVEYLIQSKFIKNIKSLNISNNPIGDNGAEFLAKIPLYRLSIVKTKVTNVGISFFTLQSLIFLDIFENKITKEALDDLQNTLPKCDIRSNFLSGLLYK